MVYLHLIGIFQKTCCKYVSGECRCVKSVRIWSYSGQHFPVFGLNTETYAGKYGPGKLRIRTLFTQCTLIKIDTSGKSMHLLLNQKINKEILKRSQLKNKFLNSKCNPDKKPLTKSIATTSVKLIHLSVTSRYTSHILRCNWQLNQLDWCSSYALC